MTAQEIELRISDTVNGLTRGLFYHSNVNDQNRALLRDWLQAMGCRPTKIASASDYVLANAYRAGRPYIDKMNREDDFSPYKPKRFPRGGRAFGLDEATPSGDKLTDLLNKSLSEIPDREAAPPRSEPDKPLAVVDAAAIARAADAVITPRIEAAKRELETFAQRSINQQIETKFADVLAKAQIGDVLKAQILDLVNKTAQETIERLAPPRTIEVIEPVLGISTNIGVQHESFGTLMKLVQARGHNGHRLNIWVTGPTGSGKTTAAEKVAEALAPTFKNYRRNDAGTWEIIDDSGQLVDLGIQHSGPFGADSSLDADYKLIGHKNAMGEFQWTTFLRVFCYGGVYVMDEIDNWMPSALVAANAPLANGWVSTPNGMINRHPDCCIIACANTWGTGATNDYVGRAKLDAATLNRFPNKLHWPIDERLERAIAQQMGGVEWCNIVQAARANAKKQGLQVIFSPRNTFEGISLLNVGFSIAEVVELNLAAGLKPETIKALGLNELATRTVSSTSHVPLLDEFERAVQDNRMIDAIKLYRLANEHREIGLKDAKDFVESIRDGYIPFPTAAQFLGQST